MNKLESFIDASSDIASNPSFIANKFDEFMALYNILDSEVKHISESNSVFRIEVSNAVNANRLKNKIDSYIEVSKYNHQYIINSSINNNIIFIKLLDKESRLS